MIKYLIDSGRNEDNLRHMYYAVDIKEVLRRLADLIPMHLGDDIHIRAITDEEYAKARKFMNRESNYG